MANGDVDGGNLEDSNVLSPDDLATVHNEATGPDTSELRVIMLDAITQTDSETVIDSIVTRPALVMINDRTQTEMASAVATCDAAVQVIYVGKSFSECESDY